jgi:hypothetical protein
MIGAIVPTMHKTAKVKRQDVFQQNAIDFRKTIGKIRENKQIQSLAAKGKERKGKERKGKERKGKAAAKASFFPVSTITSSKGTGSVSALTFIDIGGQYPNVHSVSPIFFLFLYSTTR